MLVGTAPVGNGRTFVGFRRLYRYWGQRSAGAYADHQPHRLGGDAGHHKLMRGRVLYRDRGLAAGQSDQPDPRANHGRLPSR